MSDANGCRSWIMRITVQGVRRDIGLCPLATRSLAEARDKAHAIRKVVAVGHNAIAKRSTRPAAAKPAPVVVVEPSQPTLEVCWRAHWLVKEPQLSNGRHRDQWVSTMDACVLPRIGKRPVADVTGSGNPTRLATRI